MAFFFVAGVNLLFNRKVYSLWRNLKYVTVGLLVLSVSLAFIFASSKFRFGGAVGNMISDWLTDALGNIGTAALLLVVGLGYIIWQFNHHLPVVAHMKTLRSEQLEYIKPADFIKQELLVNGIALFIWLIGFGFLLFSPRLRKFQFLAFAFILYSTFLTRTGILGDTSVHAFTDAGSAINIMLIAFLAIFTLPALILFFINYNKIPSINKEERTDSREFWMFIGSIVFFLAAIFISAKTSVPVFNKMFGTKIAPPEDPEFSYNKVMVLVAFIIGILTAISQYFTDLNAEAAKPELDRIHRGLEEAMKIMNGDNHAKKNN